MILRTPYLEYSNLGGLLPSMDPQCGCTIVNANLFPEPNIVLRTIYPSLPA
jgi:hypothetical protein